MTRRAVLPPTDTERGAVREGQRVWIEALAGGGHDARLVRSAALGGLVAELLDEGER